MNLLQEKQVAAFNALKYIKTGMVVGIGTGSTAEIFVAALGERIKNERLEIIGVPTSNHIRNFCLRHNVPVTENSSPREMDLCVDGADEFDPDFRLIKGGGGALLREKITAQAAKKLIIITDSSKKKDLLGKFPLPVEVFPHCVDSVLAKLTLIYQAYNDNSAPATPLTLRRNQTGEAFVTDFGNFIVDMPLKKITDPEKLSRKLHSIAGVAEHGLFLTEADCILCGSDTYRKTSFY